MQPGWCQPVRQEFMENECEALPGVAYPGVWDNRSTVNTKTGYDMMNNEYPCFVLRPLYNFRPGSECKTNIFRCAASGFLQLYFLKFFV